MAVITQEHLALGARAVIDLMVRATDNSGGQTAGPDNGGNPNPDDDGGEKKGSNSGTNSPLLFFVALGFGVVFTNLWIIVGVKYCFRYNARNRQMRGLDENGEPINLENMPARPHRRRREKKLMTMDEVNEKFPMVKYKTWVLERAREGLPTAGGVSVPPSRANSVRSVQGIVPETAPKERQSTEEQRNATASRPSTEEKTTDSHVENPDSGEKPKTGVNDTMTPTTTQDEATVAYKDAAARHDDDDDDEDEQIDAALPPELAGAPGDTCAICIDTLEDNDDVRGLTCGHAFHAVCLDPWLTNRRACCPLCKADYYTPKPRPAPAEGDAANAASGNDPARNNDRMNMPRTPQRTFHGWALPGGAQRHMLFTGNRWGGSRAQPADSSYGHSRSERQSRSRRQPTTPAPETSETATGGNGAGLFSRIRSRIPQLPLNTRNRDAQDQAGVTASGGNGPATPSQLEAGTRPAAQTAQ